jgi:hypothetical protein
MYQLAGSVDGIAQMLSVSEMFGLTFEETELEGLTVLK